MKALVHRHIEEGFNHGDWNVCQHTLADNYTARYGAVLVHALTPRVARWLRELNPTDEAMSQRAKLGRATSALPQNQPDSP